MVIFFELTNLPMTFQTIVNDFLRDLIKTRDMVAFINDVIIGTKIKKEYNKIIEEILKRIV